MPERCHYRVFLFLRNGWIPPWVDSTLLQFQGSGKAGRNPLGKLGVGGLLVDGDHVAYPVCMHA